MNYDFYQIKEFYWNLKITGFLSEEKLKNYENSSSDFMDLFLLIVSLQKIIKYFFYFLKFDKKKIINYFIIFLIL